MYSYDAKKILKKQTTCLNNFFDAPDEVLAKISIIEFLY
jgi:hypothetical protein